MTQIADACLLLIFFERAVCLTSAYALGQARRNFELRYPTFLSELDVLIRRCEMIEVFPTELPVQLNEKDRPILAGAITGKATHLMTGDQKDFGHLFGKTVEGVKIVSPQMLAEELVDHGWL